MHISVKLLIICLVASTGLSAQSSAGAKVSVTILSPASVVGSYKAAMLKSNREDEATVTFFSQPSSKLARRSSFQLPILKQKINFANLLVSNTGSVFDISLPQTVTLKNVDGEEVITAYKFEHDANFTNGAKKTNRLIQLSAFVATATDQEMGVYESVAVEVILNYN